MKRKATSTVEQISITAEATLNPQQKVTAHMKADGYEGHIGIKLRGNSSLSLSEFIIVSFSVVFSSGIGSGMLPAGLRT